MDGNCHKPKCTITGHLPLVSANPASEAEVRGVALSVPRCLWCSGARAIFEMEEHDGTLPTDNGRLANAD